MLAVSWTTTEQGTWFEERKGSFSTAQKACKVDQYLTEAQSDWFERWPEVEILFGEGTAVSDLDEEQTMQYSQALKRRKAMRSHDQPCSRDCLSFT